MPKVIASATALIMLPLVTVLLVAASPQSRAQSSTSARLAAAPDVLPVHDIPHSYLTWSESAARTCPGLPWLALARIDKVENDHGSSTAPGVQSGANNAGAEGPMHGQVIQAPKRGEDVQIDPLDLADVVVATRPADLAAHS